MPTSSRAGLKATVYTVLALCSLHAATASAQRKVVPASPKTAASAVAAPLISPNRPPEFIGTDPGEFFRRRGKSVRVGHSARFIVEATDHEGDSLSFAAVRLPKGAQFEPDLQEFSWTPGPEAVGTHVIKLSVSDGRHPTKRVFRIEVHPNRAPQLKRPSFRLATGKRFSAVLSAHDPDRDELTWSIKSLPAGARFDSKEGRLTWRPKEGQTGRHEIPWSASDGELSTDSVAVLQVVTEWDSFLIPGVGYSAWWTASGTLGTMHGVSIELVPWAMVHRNENRGPSHARTYLKADILRSTRADVPVAVVYAAGLTLSVERNPRRRFLVPYYGFDIGGLIQDDTGHRFHITPHAGLHVWTARNGFLNLYGGYLIAPGAMSELAGWRAGAMLDFTLW